MTMMKTFKIHQVFFITLIIFVNSSHGRIPSVRLCGDSRCESKLKNPKKLSTQQMTVCNERMNKITIVIIFITMKRLYRWQKPHSTTTPETKIWSLFEVSRNRYKFSEISSSFYKLIHSHREHPMPCVGKIGWRKFRLMGDRSAGKAWMGTKKNVDGTKNFDQSI